MNNKEILIQVKDLSRFFKVGRKKILKAVDHVTFDIYKGETLGVVGESGCGKTTCGRTVLGMYKATSGSVLYGSTDIHALKGKEKKAFKKRIKPLFS